MNLEWLFGLSGNSKVLFFTYLVHPDRDVILAIVNTNIEFWKTIKTKNKYSKPFL